MNTHAAFALVMLAGIGAASAVDAAEPGRCAAASGERAATVVELYTSQGCSSCPPADAWLSKLKGEPGVVPLAFHVDYWDQLGWKDRYASRANTERQAEQRKVNGARYSYTPQVVIDGVDRPDWPGAKPTARGAAKASLVDVKLQREGDRVVATVVPRGSGAPKRLAAIWALTENGHTTAVAAGENRGARLGNDAVVLRWEPVAAWQADPTAPRSLRFDAPVAAAAAKQAVSLVVVDAATGRPIDAVSLGC